MAIKSEWVIGGFILLAVLMMNNNAANTGTNGTANGVDLSQVVNPTAQFTAQRTFQIGTTITGEYVRIIESNGMKKDLGYKSTNSGTQSVVPTGKYNLYFAMNASKTAGSGYYTDKMVYTGKSQDAVDPVTASLCLIGTPTITVFDEFGSPQGATANEQAMAANYVRDVSIRVRAPSRQCVGNTEPESVGNALCLRYNSTQYKSAVVNGADVISTPNPVSSSYAGSAYNLICYKADVLTDGAAKDYVVTLSAQNTEVTDSTGNVSVYFKDSDMDLNAQTLEEIWGFQDEDNNQIGSNVVAAAIDVS